MVLKKVYKRCINNEWQNFYRTYTSPAWHHLAKGVKPPQKWANRKSENRTFPSTATIICSVVCQYVAFFYCCYFAVLVVVGILQIDASESLRKSHVVISREFAAKTVELRVFSVEYLRFGTLDVSSKS